MGRREVEGNGYRHILAQLPCYKGQEKNDVIAGGRSRVRRMFFNIEEITVCLSVDEKDLISRGI